MRPRFTKVVRDLTADPARNLMLVLAIGVGVFGIGTMLGAFSVLTQTMRSNYLGTVPASATIEVDPARELEPAVLDEVARLPGVARVDRRATLSGRMNVGGAWLPLLIFVVDDFEHMRTNQVRSLAGAWPPPTGTMLVERTALEVMKAAPGQAVLVRSPRGPAQPLAISGVVHDPGLAPAWQEKEGYAYVTRATLRQLGETQGFDELRVLVSAPAPGVAEIEAVAVRVARLLAGRGYSIHEIQVPRPRAHPHQGQMNAVLSLFIVFAFLTLILGALLVASSIAALMTRQIREIGVMKAVGARSSQVAGLYFFMVGVLALAAVGMGIPLSRLAGAAMVAMIAQLLNLDVVDATIPAWVAAVQLATGVLIPLLLTVLPIVRGSRISVRQALDHHGVSSRFGVARLDVWLARFGAFGQTFSLSLRNAFRQRSRLLLTLALLAAGGAVFMSALNLSRMWDVKLRTVTEYRRDDVELRLAEGAHASAALLEQLRHIPGVVAVEPWAVTETAFGQTGAYPVVRTYPDKGHAGSAMVALPLDTRLLRPYPLLSGRWLSREGDAENELVFNQIAHAQVPRAKLGDLVHVTIEGKDTAWRLVGFVQDIGSPAATAYVSAAAYARAVGPENAIRVAFADRGEATSRRLTGQIEALLEAHQVRVRTTTPITELRSAIADHMRVLVSSLLALALLMAVVGSLGLASTMSVNVLERTRELGVMRAIGATPARIARLIVGEGLVTGGLSLVFAFALSLPLSSAIGGLIGRMAFRAPLALAISPPALAWWVGLVVVGSIAATLYPAARAARLTTREALAYE